MLKMLSASGPTGRVLRNFGLQLGGELGGQLIAFIIAIHLARVLDPHGFGIWVFASSMLLYCTVVIDGGTDVWGMREAAARPRRLKRLTAGILRSRLILGVVTSCAVIAFAMTVDHDERISLLVGLPILLAFVFNTGWAHKGLETGLTGFTILVQRLTMLVIVLALIRSPTDAPYVTFWQAIAESVGVIILMIALLPRFRNASPGPTVTSSFVFAHSWPLALVKAMRPLTATSAVIALSVTSTSSEVGYYGAALRIATILVLASSVLINVAFPSLTRAFRRNNERGVMNSVLRLLLVATMPVAIGGILVAEPLINAIFSPEFQSAAKMLAILLGAHFAMAISDFLRRVLAARNQQRLDFKLTLASTIFALTGTIWLASAFGGTGAAVAMLASELFLAGLAFWGVTKTGPKPAVFEATMLPLVGASIMGAVVAVASPLPLVARIALGFLTYVSWLAIHRRRLSEDLTVVAGAR